MSLSEVFDTGSGAMHPWANLRINNLTVDGTLTTNGQIIQQQGLVNTYFDILVGETVITPVTYRTIPVTVSTGTYSIYIEACACSTAGTPGGGVYNIFGTIIGINDGVFTTTTPATGTTPTILNMRSAYTASGTLGVLVTTSGTNILLQAQNGFAGNITDWQLITKVIGPIV
jgi:hypothetical protein